MTVKEIRKWIFDRKDLSDLIKKAWLEPFDHKTLNLDVKEFFQLNPTAENIAVAFTQTQIPIR